MKRSQQEYTARVHFEEGSYWAEVTELPGCFAAGDDPVELEASLVEAIALALDLDPADLTGRWQQDTEERKLLVLT